MLAYPVTRYVQDQEPREVMVECVDLSCLSYRSARAWCLLGGFLLVNNVQRVGVCRSPGGFDVLR